ncbi:MAG TPA: translation initiation factor IF-2 [Candidatus Saccharimonadales bacterium]|nr:translation initiation factor IF-2 [Candidatus Saccharimonadales bacterium]
MAEKLVVQIPEEISVRALAALLKVDATAVIGKLIAGGVMATINQSLDFDTACLVAEEFGNTAEAQSEQTTINKTTDSKDAVTRAPIVTIMGHVDHGKTSLLDFIRKSNITAGESGGITQHISAYQIDFKGEHGARKITFIDTPGHEAFSALREHGATITDIVILVVAADDGVKPQTIEAIEHAKKANVPIIVAINKIDSPGANVERVKQQLSEHDLIPEDWTGKTVMVPISARTGEGVDRLLDMVVLTADMQELKADPNGTPEAIVIEANLDKQVGPVATILVFNGTVRTGQVLVVGKTYGRVKAMEDDLGVKISQAGPAKPARLFGLKDVPKFGERIEVVPSEKVARTMTQSGLKTKSAGGDSERNSIKIVIKADVGGSLAALEESIKKLTYKDASVEIVTSGIGPVNENDVNLAKASAARILAFRVPINKRITELAGKEGVDLNEYWVIYELTEMLEKELKSIATTTFVNVQLGRLRLLAVFSWNKGAGIVGGEVLDGVVKPNVSVEIFREKEQIGTAKAGAMKIGKLEVDQAEKGTQCGISLSDSTTDPAVGDVLNFFETKEEK